MSNQNEQEPAVVDRLPFPYSEALRLRAAGIADAVIAQVLGVDIDAIDSILEVAEAKLATLRERHTP